MHFSIKEIGVWYRDKNNHLKQLEIFKMKQVHFKKNLKR